ncbi:MAG: YybH family protein [Caulobacteraceae bacterium]
MRRWMEAAALAVGGVVMSAGSALAAAPPQTAAVKPAATRAVPAGHRQSDLARLFALQRRWLAGFNAENVDELMSVYAPDVFVFDAIPPRQYVGAAAYRKDWQGLFAALPHQTTKVEDLKISVVGPVAWSHETVSTDATAKDGSHRTLAVRQTDVYRKLGGRWRIVQEHVSFPVDIDTGKADLLSKP